MQPEMPTPAELTFDTIQTHLTTDESAREFLEQRLWTNGPTCPRCNANDETVYKMTGKSTRPGLYNCRACRRQFSVTVGTIFEDSHIPLRKWLVAWYLLCSSKKGISSLQLQRMLDLGSYRTALFMTHRIRHAMKETTYAKKMTGTVEIDECYIGPKNAEKRQKSKTGVVALVSRETGERRTVLMKRVTGITLQQAILDNVEPGSTINTDESPMYKALKSKFEHKTVCHKRSKTGEREFYRTEADGKVVTTNHAESSFSLLRRGVIGTFHNISQKHLHLYVAEFDFRFNQRNVTDGERTANALGKARGKRLTYR